MAAGKVLVLVLFLLLLPVTLYGFLILIFRGSVAKAKDDELCQELPWCLIYGVSALLAAPCPRLSFLIFFVYTVYFFLIQLQ